MMSESGIIRRLRDSQRYPYMASVHFAAAIVTYFHISVYMPVSVHL